MIANLQQTHERGICDVLLKAHQTVNLLFAKVLNSDDIQESQTYFGQLYLEVKAHGLTEEQVLYPALRPYYEPMAKMVEQTDYVFEMLDEIKVSDPTDTHFNVKFKTRVDQLWLAVRSHLHQEEQDLFPEIKEHLSLEQQKKLATEFEAAKRKLQAHRT